MKPIYEELKQRIFHLEQENLKWKQLAEEIKEKGQRYEFLDILESIEEGYCASPLDAPSHHL